MRTELQARSAGELCGAGWLFQLSCSRVSLDIDEKNVGKGMEAHSLRVVAGGSIPLIFRRAEFPHRATPQPVRPCGILRCRLSPVDLGTYPLNVSSSENFRTSSGRIRCHKISFSFKIAPFYRRSRQHLRLTRLPTLHRHSTVVSGLRRDAVACAGFSRFISFHCCCHALPVRQYIYPAAGRFF